ncbi:MULTISPECIES: 2,3-diaminopropionate biosynthesis protein SbnB [unclassified Streptomyces]|uniref:2,3-diaminopropionate biosynthesis protein SbnB n=1 Tax=unclassified Streptomyces TaxID=2593676 RepID=UPI002DDA6ED3|nr:2,3-diaminopropionate biosynthesis protein SbnB [Streptomyces sp. NBC_01257]WRZ63432.1 2,3-diaminopropionate biosynthesis protein SbnB [Streptomyces sp. NBC_01257]WSU57395.1 2,3-diaminopropionate biosynthesis protein SbnB [Streptomyces sp. NBC_01104]
MSHAPSFAVIPGEQVAAALHGQEKQVTELVEAAYRIHGEGLTVNPDSYFLRFPDRPSSRIIALPASVGGEVNVHGIKWISSFPENVEAGIPRASAVLVLNDTETGYPFACLESSIISAARTAASAALAACAIADRRGARPRRVGFVGTGLIARYLHTYLTANGMEFDEVGVHDLRREHAEGFRGYLRRAEPGTAVTVHDSVDSLLPWADLIVLATVAGEPHILDPGMFAHNPLVLHVSLRDLGPEIILGSCNVVDDIDHCLKANTSPHLAEQRTGNRDFLDGTLYDVLEGRVVPPADKPVVFSPFGLGVLDMAVAKHVYDTVTDSGELATVPGFFHEMRRYG